MNKNIETTNVDRTTIARARSGALLAVASGLIALASSNFGLAQAPPPGLSPGVADVAKMSVSRVPDDVVLDFLKGKGYTYNLTTDDVIYLNGAGVTKPVLDYMIASGPAGAPPAVEAVAPPVVAPIAPPDGSAAPPPNLNLGYFQGQLSPYGQWVDLPPYGQVWRPAAAASDPNWRPYSQDGHWVFTASGWFWQTDSPWGALVFHYGRWSLDPNAGWVWVPGYNWGPSWVAWRHSDGYYGWAPLPPAAVFQAGIGLSFNGLAVGASVDFGLRANCFTFVGCNNIFDHDYRAVWVPRDRVTVVFGGSTILNSYHVDHGRFVVEGFGREHIIEHSNIKVVNVVSVREQVNAQNVTVVKNVTNIRNETNVKGVTNVRNVNNEKNVSNVNNQRNTSNVKTINNEKNVNNVANERNVANEKHVNNVASQRNVNNEKTTSGARPAVAAVTHAAVNPAVHPATGEGSRPPANEGGRAEVKPPVHSASPPAAVKPAERPAIKPVEKPAVKPAAKPVAKPVPKPAPAKPEEEKKSP
jgi:hypothetical protein